jgi:hypothetical protein
MFVHFRPRLYESLRNGHIYKLRVGTLQAANLSLHRSDDSYMIVMIWRREHTVTDLELPSSML